MKKEWIKLDMTDRQRSFLNKVARGPFTRPRHWDPMHWLRRMAGEEEVARWLKNPLSRHPDYAYVYMYLDMYGPYTFLPNSIWLKAIRSKL